MTEPIYHATALALAGRYAREAVRAGLAWADVTCLVETCEAAPHCRGYCNAHYQQALKAGLPRKVGRDPRERFMDYVSKTETCWLWTGAKADTGYGTFSLGGRADRRTVLSHRFSYETFVGPIPAGLVLDHLCRVPACVNPAHLEPVTNAENVLRGESPNARAVRQNKCGRGHEYTPENTLTISTTGRRHCRACKRLRYQARQARPASQDGVA